MFEANVDLGNGTQGHFLIFDMTGTEIDSYNEGSTEQLLMICWMNTISSGCCCTFYLNADHKAFRFEKKMQLPRMDAEALASWIDDHINEIIQQI